MTDIDGLIRGSIDMHIHAAPDIMPMRLNALEAARQAIDRGMRAIVIKNHSYPTAPLAAMVGELIPDIRVFGGICLDDEVGGLNSHALEISAKLGAKVVWMPTLSAVNSRGKIAKSLGLPLEGEGYSILDEGGKLVPEISRILAIVKKYDMVLATGHISPMETLALFKEAKTYGIDKMIATHVSSADVVDKTLSLEEQKKLAGMGVFLEHAGNDIMPCDFGHDPADIAAQIKAVGAGNCILSSDMGMVHGLYPVEGMRIFVSSLLRQGIRPEEIELMIKMNPAKLLGLS